MITYAIISGLFTVFSYILNAPFLIFRAFMPNLDESFTEAYLWLDYAIGLFKTFMVYFPPLETMWYAFLVYIGWRIFVRIISFIPIIRNGFSHINDITY